MAKRGYIRIFTLVFILCLFLPLIFFNRDRRKVSVGEKRYLAVFPNPFTREGFEDWINDNIGFRTPLTGMHAHIMYRLLGLSPSEKIKAGKDGWLFFTGDNNLRIAEGTYPLFEEDMETIIKSQEETERYLKENNCDYYLILPPAR